MQAAVEQLRPFLRDFDFTGLFVDGLGWDHYHAAPVMVSAGGHDYALAPVAEKRGFAVFECAPDADGGIPPYPVRRKVEAEVAKRVFEHLIVYSDATRTQQVWQWVRRESGKPNACHERRFTAGQSGDLVLQPLREVAFSLEEEAEGLGVADVTGRIRRAFDVEKVTKRFYERFRSELTAFGDFIDGIAGQGDRDWYASLMLNRMMFVYFVQKQGFLDNDTGYLRNRLRMVQQQNGEGRFQQFYRIFLLRLFHEGLGQPEAQRKPDLAALLGKVPFLNGGLFDQHELERDNPDIAIPDEAFERVFDFFDAYQWHLDTRPGRVDNEIDPDVLGYIFEKYVNQKQMGAYYTKEDITGYIARNTVIPFLFDAARKECPVAFGPDGGVWRLLRDDPDRYIYPAVAHGASLPLPDDIAAGVADVAKRGGWNSPAPDEYALPTETWREVVARRQRHAEVRAKLTAGGVTDVNDCITLNLDVETFARDVIALSEGPELVRAFWKAVSGVSVLDPTCGSGAFLFAALNVLEPLYTACLEGMRGFLDDAERSERKRGPGHLSDFHKVLDQVREHPSERYFILKSIVLNNLYGVDIMEEAVEICKLRLFLKLVAQLEKYEDIEPLPDIDFNVRAGNTLVGFTSLDAVREAMTRTPDGQHRQVFPEDQAALDRIEEEAGGVDWLAHEFRRQQTMLGEEVTLTDKQTLRDRLDSLANELDRYLATEYGVDLDDVDAYGAWRVSHQPFHWFVEFYGIMSTGGFDVVIGNPPYVEYSKVKSDYAVKGYKTEPCGNLYAYVVERSRGVTKLAGTLSMIVPLALVSTQRMVSVQGILETEHNCWYSNYSMRPGKLFDLADQALTIFVVKSPSGNPMTFSTCFRKWHSDSRGCLFPTMAYVQIPRNRKAFWAPKFGHRLEWDLLKKCISIENTMSEFVGGSRNAVFYRTTGGRYWKIFTDFAPEFSLNGVSGSSSRETMLFVRDRRHVSSCIALLSSTLFWWWYTITSNLRDLNPSDWSRFAVTKSILDDSVLQQLGEEYVEDLKVNSVIEHGQRRTGSVTYQLFNVQKSKPIIDEIDQVLAKHYGFTDEELDFIINYDIKYRMGREG